MLHAGLHGGGTYSGSCLSEVGCGRSMGCVLDQSDQGCTHGLLFVIIYVDQSDQGVLMGCSFVMIYV